MTKQLSFTRQQQETMRSFRQRMDMAESTEDVRKFFRNSMQEFLGNILNDQREVGYEDISLEPDSDAGYRLDDSLMENGSFQKAWNQSDLPHIMNNFAQNAINRMRKLEKNELKTRAKIRR